MIQIKNHVIQRQKDRFSIHVVSHIAYILSKFCKCSRRIVSLVILTTCTF